MNHFDINNSFLNMKLQSDLGKYGLNPAEWTLHRIKSSLSYLIKNRFDESFTMYGELEFRKQKPQWRSLEVVSI